MKKIIYWLDENIENTLIFPMYFSMMMIMAIGVVQRFFFSTAWHWAVYICIALFVWFSWIGCAWNIKERAHLRLSFFRDKMPRPVQFALMMMDYVMWMIFGGIAVYYAVHHITRLHETGAMIYGTANIPQWVVPLSIPVAFSLLFIRVIQCAVKDIRDFISGRPLQTQPTTTVHV
jgi:TRAP-type C4-dicarboxylate transport system permease small subunit